MIDQKGKNFTVLSRLALTIMEIPYEGAENALKVYIAVSNQFSNLGLDPHFPTNLADLNSAGSNNSNILIFESIQSLV